MRAFWSRTVGRVPAPRARARPRVALCTLSLASLGRTARIGALSKDLEGLSLKRKACLLRQQINPEKDEGIGPETFQTTGWGKLGVLGTTDFGRRRRSTPDLQGHLSVSQGLELLGSRLNFAKPQLSVPKARTCSLSHPPPAPQERSSCLLDLSHPSCKSAPGRALLAQFRHCLGPSRSPALTPAYLFFSLSAVIVAVFLRDPEHLGSLGP